MTFRPRLRSEIETVVADGKPGLYDPPTGRFIAAGAITQALVEELTKSAGTRTVDEIVSAVAARKPDRDVETVQASLRGLMLLCLIEGSGDETRARLAKLTSGQVPIVYPEGARFGCQGSGQCCRVYDVPVSEEDIARLEKLDLGGAFPELAGGPYYEQRASVVDPRRVETFLAQRGSRCIFLTPTERCGLHGKFGPESKPRVCRLFPWRSLLTVDGMKVFDQGECASFAVSARSGDRIEEQLGSILPLLPKNPSLFHPVAYLPDDAPCDYGWVLDLAKRATALVERGPAIGPLLLALASLTRTWATALSSCSFEAGEPAPSIAKALDRDVTVVAAVPEPSIEARVALVRLCDAFGEAPEEDWRGPLTSWVRDMLGATRAIVAHSIDPQRHECPPELELALALPLDSADVDSILRISFLNHFFGDGTLVASRVLPALLRLAITVVVSIIGARLQAVARGGDRVVATDLSYSHSAAAVALRRPCAEGLLVACEPLTFGVVEAIAALAWS